MRANKLNKVTREKAFIGALVGTVAGVVGGAISAKKKRKAEQKAFDLEQAEQLRTDGIAQANALSDMYNNQQYVDEYKNKITLKNGGRVSSTGKLNDRVKQVKKYSQGGKHKTNTNTRDKKFLGSLVGKDGVGGEVSDGIGGFSTLATSIFSKPDVPKQIVKSDGATFGTPKTGLVPNSYVDDDKTPVYNDRLQIGRLGLKKKVKRIK